jgi:hypothetical protein
VGVNHFFAQIVCALASIFSIPQISAALADPPPAESAHLQTVGAPRLSFHDGHWHDGVRALGEVEQKLVSGSTFPYVVVEAFADGLTDDAEVSLMNEDGKIIDSLRVTPLTENSTVVSIPLPFQEIRVRASMDGAGKGRVVISRVMAPPPAGDSPNALLPMLTPASAFSQSGTPGAKELYQAARGVVLIQVAAKHEIITCSGFLVTNDLVATAAHCIQPYFDSANEKNGGGYDARCDKVGVAFEVQGRIGTPVSIHCNDITYFSVKQQFIDVMGGSPPRFVDQADIALLRVNPSAISARPRPPLTIGSATTEPAYLISYPWGGIERIASACGIQSGIGALLYHRCSTTPGSSGAPVLQWIDGKYEVVGIHVCCSNQGSIDGNTQELFHDAQGLFNVAISGAEISTIIKKYH